MIFIYKEFVKNNINKLTIEQVKKFADKNSFTYSEEELVTVYNFIKYYYNDLLDEDIKVFENIRNDLNPKLYKDLLNLYIEYKQKYL